MPRFRKVTFGRVKSQLLRPRKSEAEKRKRLKVWRKRLVKLGVPAERAELMQYVEARTLLKRPAKLAKSKKA